MYVSFQSLLVQQKFLSIWGPQGSIHLTSSKTGPPSYVINQTSLDLAKTVLEAVLAVVVVCALEGVCGGFVCEGGFHVGSSNFIVTETTKYKKHK